MKKESAVGGELFPVGQRVRVIRAGDLALAPVGALGTVTYPLDEWGDIGVRLDDDPKWTSAFGVDEITPVVERAGDHEEA